MVLETVYWDTKDQVLAKAGITLSRCTGGADSGWLLKFPDRDSDDHMRVQLPLGTDPNAVPVEFERALEDRVHNKILCSFFRVRTEDTLTAFFGPEDELIAEMANDHAPALSLVDLALAIWSEIEVEERDMSQSTLEQLENLLRLHGARVLSHDLRTEPVQVGPALERSTSRRDPLTFRLREQRAAFLACETDVQSGQDDAVHQMRVATRRLRSCLRTFGDAFVVNPTRHLSTELKWLGGYLGAERDAEVIYKRIVKALDELQGEQISGPVRAALTSRAWAEVLVAHDHLMEAMKTERYQSLLEELGVFADHPPYRSRRRGTRWLARQLAKTVRRTEKLVKHAEALEGAGHEVALHEIRKAAKHVRYAAETLAPALRGKTSSVKRSFESLQEVLGEHHDATVARDFIREEGARTDVGTGESGFIYGLLCGREEARAAAAEFAFSGAWRRARRSVRGVI